MRTLKKSLALVLALVMVLGLAVVGASADNAIDKFEDSDQIGDAYLEAVGVLTGLAIVDGMTDTEIAPQGTYQRDQAAKIIAYMVLGKEAADSLVASYAPFQDVPADYWAAGYIAFCKEQGIIDGVSDTSFDPYGTLTGFQWAKMLLAAVGFNANNELEGDSWSLNTARTGHEVGLFDGDNAGADHVALRREQAMLYAFNTLTNVRQVSYTGNGNNYVYDIFGYEWADGTGYTLGYDVFDLKFVEGQIVDNEGMGANATYVANANYKDKEAWQWWIDSGEKLVDVKADTGLDLMYHAVRVWYTGSNTNVYVNDLAKVTTYECMHQEDELEKALDDLDKDDYNSKFKQLGTGTAYETYIIDNSALDLSKINDASGHATATKYAVVTLNANFGELGFAGKKTTDVLTSTGKAVKAVDNDDIMTDISKIAYGDEIVYVVTTSVLDKPADGEAWYIYPVTTTEGVVEKVSQKDGVTTVTLTDDTVLEMSAFWPDYGAVKDYPEVVIGRNYTFVLDTHGDVIYATRDYSRDLYAFTNEWRWQNEHSAISGDWVREYRFINVTTGEYFWAPVVDKSGKQPYEGGNFAYETYYDLSSGTTSKGYYVATAVTTQSNPYTEQYVIDTFELTEDKDQVKATGVKGEKVYFDVDNITFLVTEGSGADMIVHTYNGLDEFKAAVGMGNIGTFNIKNACFTVSDTLTGHKYADVCFIFGDSYKASMNYVFVPTTVMNNDWDSVEGDALGYKWSYDGAYYEGKNITVYFTNDKNVTDGVRLARGFYKYNFENGKYYLSERVPSPKNAYYQDVDFTNESISADRWTFTDSVTGAENTAYGDEVTIVDIGNKIWDEGTEITLNMLRTYCDRIDSTARLAYTVDPSTTRVDFIYVTAEGWESKVTFEVLGTSDLAPVLKVTSGPVLDDTTGSVTMAYTGSWPLVDGATYKFTTVEGYSFDAVYTAATKTFSANVSGLPVVAGTDKTLHINGIYTTLTVEEVVAENVKVETTTTELPVGEVASVLFTFTRTDDTPNFGAATYPVDYTVNDGALVDTTVTRNEAENACTVTVDVTAFGPTSFAFSNWGK